ncbi:hypothetical protein C8J56DRAFT_946578 [Mycena floridula]|nr:hypothetical protein C8J56DRAFT_946578 [Mycena floridula]
MQLRCYSKHCVLSLTSCLSLSFLPAMILFLLGLCVSQLVEAQFSAARNFWPGSYPLAVRSPYLNSWFNIQAGTTNLKTWPTPWDVSNNNGWSGAVRVDGVAFAWMGDMANATNLQSSEVTPTRTMFTITAGPVLLNITFLSPIEPTDLVKQSLPFSYLAIDVVCTDGKSHSVQLYSDITAGSFAIIHLDLSNWCPEWVTSARSNIVVWNTTQTGNSVYHQFSRQTPVAMQENDNMVEDATVYYGTKGASGLSFQSGGFDIVHAQFVKEGRLLDTQDTAFRAISEDFPVFGLSVDLGTISATASPVVWAIGVVRDPVIQFATDFAGLQSRSSFFWTQFHDISAVIDSFLADFPDALNRAVAFDQRVMQAADQVSLDYADLVSLVARQTLAGVDWTVSRTSNGDWDLSDVKAFMRDTGGTRRVNAVETLYAALPTYLYLNASWVGLLLDPLLEYQASTLYKNSFAAPDLGFIYPQAVGNTDPNSVQGMEDSGDMLIMAWAHATFSGDGRLISRYYSLLKTWADYLVEGSLRPIGQTVDGLSKPYMTNLAIKGIIGIQAMASISKAIGNVANAQHYSSTAASYANQWKALASTSGHLTSTYDSSPSTALIYNLFADKLLKFGLVDDQTYAAQTAFYSTKLASAPKFGLPFDSDTSTAKAQWSLFTAATVTNTSTRDALVSMIRSRASYNATSGPFPASYDVTTGETTNNNGQASPALGAVMSILALTLQNQTITGIPDAGSTTAPSSKPGKKKTATIVGGILAGMVVLLCLALLFLRRRRRQRAYAAKPETIPIPFFDGIPPMSSWSYPRSPPYPSPVTQKETFRPQSEAVGIAPSVQLTSSDSEAILLRDQVQGLILEVAELRAQQRYDMAPPPPFSA